MEIVFLTIWGVLSLLCVLIIPIGYRIEHLDDDNWLKQWWENHMISINPYEKD